MKGGLFPLHSVASISPLMSFTAARLTLDPQLWVPTAYPEDGFHDPQLLFKVTSGGRTCSDPSFPCNSKVWELQVSWSLVTSLTLDFSLTDLFFLAFSHIRRTIIIPSINLFFPLYFQWLWFIDGKFVELLVDEIVKVVLWCHYVLWKRGWRRNKYMDQDWFYSHKRNPFPALATKHSGCLLL